MDALKNFAQDVKTKVLNLNRTPLEKLLHEATTNDNWGANPKLFRQISDSSYQYENREVILNFIFHRLSNKTKNWRKILKTLELIEYLIKNGLYDMCSDFRRDIVHITTHCDFQMTEKGIDRGLSIRVKASKLVQLLSDDSELQYEREQAKQLYQRSMNLQGFGSDNPQCIVNKSQKKKPENIQSYDDEDDLQDDVYKYQQNKDSDDDNKIGKKVGSDFELNENKYEQQEEQSGSQDYSKIKSNGARKEEIQNNKLTKGQQSNDFWQQQWEWGFAANSNKIQSNDTKKQFWNQEGFNENSQQNQKQEKSQQQNERNQQQQQQQKQQQQQMLQQQQQLLEQQKKKQEEQRRLALQQQQQAQQQQQQYQQLQIQKQQQMQKQLQEQKKKETEFNLLDLDIVVPPTTISQQPQQVILQQQQQQTQPPLYNQGDQFSQPQTNQDPFIQFQQPQSNLNKQIEQKQQEDQYKNFSKDEQNLIDLDEIKKEKKKDDSINQFETNFMQFNSSIKTQNFDNSHQNTSEGQRDYSALNIMSAYQQQLNAYQQNANIYGSVNQANYYQSYSSQQYPQQYMYGVYSSQQQQQQQQQQQYQQQQQQQQQQFLNYNKMNNQQFQ